MLIKLLLTLALFSELKMTHGLKMKSLVPLFNQKVAEFKELSHKYHDKLLDFPSDKKRFQIFVKAYRFVKSLNSGSNKNWRAVLNPFSMMTEGEKKLYHGLNRTSMRDNDPSFSPKKRDLSQYQDATKEAPIININVDEVDWTHKIPPVKNQAGCGSCWAFAGTAPLEYQLNKYKDDITSLSEQQCVDCAYSDDANGCAGGWMDACWYMVQHNGNIAAGIDEYGPYTAADGPCKTTESTKSSMGDYKILGWKWTVGFNEDVQRLVANPKTGVVAALVQANGAFGSYGGGVFDFKECYSYNHGVAIVGYGIDNGLKFWKVRNSWGTWFGERGYIRMLRGPGISICNIVTWPEVPYVATDAEEPTYFHNNEIGMECISTEVPFGYFYRGTINVTKSGRKCQNWLSMTPNAHDTTPEANFNEGIGDHNYCRNPDSSPDPWCYNGEGTDPVREACDVPRCACGYEIVAVESQRMSKAKAAELCDQDIMCAGIRCDGDSRCWKVEDGEEGWEPTVGVYRKGGDSCVTTPEYAEPEEADPTTPCNWMWNLVDEGTKIFDTMNAAKEQCEIDGDACRGIFCDGFSNCWVDRVDFDSSTKKYTTYGKSCSYEDDEIGLDMTKGPDESNKLGKECIDNLDQKGYTYRGTMNVTGTGLPCQRWTSHEPNEHHNVVPVENDSRGIGDHNYCRNIGDMMGPWCFNGNGTSPMWEKCDIPLCPKCDYEITDLGDKTYHRQDALEKCTVDTACLGISCKEEKNCWLNMIGGSEVRKPTVYSKICKDICINE